MRRFHQIIRIPARRFLSSYDYDLVVIGGGSGGVATARRAAVEGVRTALVESQQLGGTCVNRGCIPKKLYWYASDYSHAFKDGKQYGWRVNTDVPMDFNSLWLKKNAEIARLNAIYQGMLEKSGVPVFNAIGEIVDPHCIRLNGRDSISADRILIATGAKPWIPSNVKGIEHAVTSDDFFEWQSMPQSVAVVGAGYIACELACIMANLGVKVEMFVRGTGILRGFDMDVRNDVSLHMEETHGIRIHTGTELTEISAFSGGFTVTTNSGAEHQVEKVLYATGRVPNIPKGLDVEFNRKGAIVVDEFSKTSVDSIYAVGDVTDRMNLTPVAIAEGKALVQTLYKNNPTPLSYANIPTAVFTQPEAASVGVGENTLVEGSGDASSVEGGVKVYKTRFRPLKNTISGNSGKTMMKLIVANKDNKVVGCHIVGPSASEMIQCIAVAVKAGATKEMFDATLPVHPTSAEELVLMNTPVE